MWGEYFRLCKLLMLDADPVERGLRAIRAERKIENDI